MVDVFPGIPKVINSMSLYKFLLVSSKTLNSNVCCCCCFCYSFIIHIIPQMLDGSSKSCVCVCVCVCVCEYCIQICLFFYYIYYTRFRITYLSPLQIYHELSMFVNTLFLKKDFTTGRNS